MQKSKKIILLVLLVNVCLLLCFLTVPVLRTFFSNTVLAETGTPDANNILYYTYDTATSNYTVSDCALIATTVTIPSTFDDGTHGELPVTVIGSSAFNGCTNLTSIEIPSIITGIGYQSFNNCSKLVSIDIPDSVSTLGNSAFYNCSKLTTVNISNTSGITVIYSSTFKNCSSLSSINIPDGVIKIWDSAFYGCSSLSTVDISNTSGLTQISDNAFYNCSSLAVIDIPDSLTSIGKYSFYGCSHLATVNISNTSGLTSIGMFAFCYCSDLSSINLPEGITKIDDNVFASCTSLTSIEIPSKVTSIGTNSFNGCTSLNLINISDKILVIGSGAFRQCTSLTNILVDANNPNYCSLEGALLDKAMTTLFTHANMYSTSYTLPDSITLISISAFYASTNLNTVNISAASGLTSIGDSAFANCTNLTTISLTEASMLTSIGVSAFNNCTNLSTSLSTTSLTSIGKFAFYNCTSLGSLNIPDTVQIIDDKAFTGCTNINTVNISATSNLTKIGVSAFSQCSSLTSISVPSSVLTISSEAFSQCTSLTNITVDENNPNYCSFNGALLNKSMTTILTYANMYSTSYTLPDSVSTIEGKAFTNCTNLTEIKISNTSQLTSIGIQAFNYCSNLNKIYILTTVPASLYDRYVFNYSGITSTSGFIYVPDASVTTYKTATYWTYLANRIFSASQLTFNMEFNSNGGTGTMTAQEFNYGVADNLNANTFNRTGYNFKGWSTTADGAVEYADEDLYTFTSLEDTILYAVWEEIPLYTVNFNGNENTSGTMGTLTFYGGDTNVIPGNAFARMGYIFMGWSTTSTGEVEYADDISLSDLVFEGESTTIDLYAVWAINTNTAYKVEYYQQNLLDNDYTLFTTSNLTGTAFDTAKAVINTYTGFTHLTNGSSVESGEIEWDGTLVLKVYYDRQIFTVIFVNNALTYDTQGVRYQGSATTPTAPTKPATAQFTYTFTGWDTVYTNVTVNLTITAVYSSVTNSYDVTFKDYDNTTLKTQSVEYGSNATPPTSPTRTGYHFTGWSGSYTNITGTTTITAVYDINTYTIIFNSNGATGGSMNDQELTYGISTALSKNNFVRIGYRFGGWTWNSETYDDEQDILNLTTTNDETLTFVAIWVANTYTIQFDANSGTGSMLNQSLTYGTSTTLSKNNFVYTGYRFGGWTWNSETYTDEQDVLNLTTTNGATLIFEAVWIASIDTAYTVEYYQQNILDDEYTLITTSNLTGTSFETVNAVITTYAGFVHITNANSLESGTIAGDGSLVLKVYYDRQIFTVTFVNNASTYDTQDIRYQGSATTPTAPTKPATAQFTYTFTGWDTDYTNVTENLTITAVYSSVVNSYDVTFKDYDNATLKTQSVEYGSNATPPSNPTRTGYTFTGWSGIYTNITGTTTITAVYDANEYAIIFNGNGATSGTMNDQTFDFDSTQNLTANAFFLEGYAFNGWATSEARADAGSVDYTDSEAYTYVDTYNITLYAVWRELTLYTINYYGNGATSGSMGATQFYEGDTINLSTVAFSKSGYTFQGWSTTSDGTVIYLNQASISDANFDVLTSLDLYAIWEENTTVTYIVEYYQQNILDDNYTLFTSSNLIGLVSTTVNAVINTYIGFTHITNANSLESDTIPGDGTLVLKVYYDRQIFTVTFVNNASIYNTQNIKYQGSATTPTNPTKTATAQYTYTFTGWDTEYTNVTENVTVTAVYSIIVNSFDVIFKDYDNTILETQSVEYGSNATPPTNPTRTGYTFAGWSDSYTNITESITLIAEYTLNEYIITFNTNGGEVINETIKVSYGGIITSLPTPTKNGYVFTGWYLNGERLEIGDSFTLADNVQLVAGWQQNLSPLSIFYMILTGIGVIGIIFGLVVLIHFARKRAKIRKWGTTSDDTSNEPVKNQSTNKENLK